MYRQMYVDIYVFYNYMVKKKVNSKQQFLNVIIKTTTRATKQYSNISLNSKHSRLV